MENLQEKFDTLISQSVGLYSDDKLKASLKFYQSIALILEAPDKEEIVKNNNITKHVADKIDIGNPDKLIGYAMVAAVSRMLGNAEIILGDALNKSNDEYLKSTPFMDVLYTEGTPTGL
ncbi:MAG: hypothetical protein EOP00_27595 [Pedobacter sp.]|nr:MAG: hypothetical protein EOP00_27595 [Pedobacter sp.]